MIWRDVIPGDRRRASLDEFLSAQFVERRDQLEVEVPEAGERQQVHDRVVEQVGVNDLVDLVVSEICSFRIL